MKYIYHHLGLGDHIICNGLVRNLINKNENYSLFVYPHNRKSVEFMYSDLSNLTFIEGNDSSACDFLDGVEPENRFICGFGSANNVSWDEAFYYPHNIDFSKRWDSFYTPRDKTREEYLYNLLNPKDEDYVLIHSKGSDDFDRINYDVIDNNIKKIFVEKHTDVIFDYSLLVEKAKEVHCVESSFHVWMDSVELNKNLFFHTLHKNRGFSHKIKDKWKIV